LEFNQSGQRFAVERADALEVWDVPKRQRLWSAPLTSPAWHLAWHPADEILLAASRADNSILVFDGDTGAVRTHYTGHSQLPGRFEFHPGGQFVASAGSEGTLRLWDPRTGRDMLVTDTRSRLAHFSTDGTRLAASVDADTLGIYELASSKVFREFAGGAFNQRQPDAFVVSRDGLWLATGAAAGASFWNVTTGRWQETIRVRGGERLAMVFSPDGGALYCSRRNAQTIRLPYLPSKQSSKRFGEPETVNIRGRARLEDIARDGTWLVVNADGGLQLWPEGNPDRARDIAPGVRGVSRVLSPDGRWLATSDGDAGRVLVWDLATGKQMATLGEGPRPERVPRAWFSSDSRWLLTGGSADYRLWEAGTWKPVRVWAGVQSGDHIGAAAFSGDGKTLALEQSNDTFLIVELPSLLDRVRLRPPFRLNAQAVLLDEQGSRLWVLGTGPRVFEWDLSKLHAELAALRLGWK